MSSVEFDDVVPSDDERTGLHRKPLAFHRVEERFHGVSSGAILIQAAMTLKRDYLGNKDHPINFRQPLHNRESYWRRLPVSYNALMFFYFLLKNFLVGKSVRRTRHSLSLSARGLIVPSSGLLF